jgi:dipeptidyl-peptidase-4
MKKTILIWVFVSLLAGVKASDMMHLLQGGYDARVLTAAEMDSILEVKSSGVQEVKGERYRLEYENKQQLFRHSFLADYYLVDTQKNTRVRMSDEPVRDAIISPNGKYVVYAKVDNNLYIYKIDFKTEVAITSDAGSEVMGRKAGDIFNGIADWLYEEEFGVTRLFAFSPDSKMVAFVRLNEKDVQLFEWQTFLSSQNSLEARGDGSYPRIHGLRYPRAGEQNAKASVCVYDIHYKSIKTMQLPEDKEYYVPRLRWGVQPAATKADAQPVADLMVMLMNRDQTQMKVLKANAKSTVTQVFYEEESKSCYVNFEHFDEWQWLDDGRVVVVSEKGGYVQAYLYSSQGMEQKLLTPAACDVMRVYGYDAKTQNLYYLAAPSPLTRQAYAYNLRKGSTTELTSGKGTHALTFSKDMCRYIDCYQSLDVPNRYTLYETARVVGNKTASLSDIGRVILSNDSVAAAWKDSGLPNKEFLTITTERGDELNAWRVLPAGFDASKR